jgi:hypothetical protein
MIIQKVRSTGDSTTRWKRRTGAISYLKHFCEEFNGQTAKDAKVQQAAMNSPFRPGKDG